ncbi:MAG: Smr/MutS family protein [Dongiaceae bacterium]
MGKRRLSAEELALWRAVASQATPLPGRTLPELPPAPAVAPIEPAPAPKRARRRALAPPPPASPARPAPPAAPPELSHGQVAGVDRRQAERLSRGRLEVEATLDLHGLTQQAAHARLDAFIAASTEAGRRCVLVITGKGLAKEAGGVLRQNVPRWLNEQPNRARVLAFDYAQQKHGGMGALYVLLKRRRAAAPAR